jgi:hypothetical protein
MSDFSPRYGLLANGIYGSARAVVQFIIIPLVLVLVTSSLLESVGNGPWSSLDQAVLGLKMTFIMFGSVLAVISFFTELYPLGSWSRLLLGHVRSGAIIILGYVLFIGSGMQVALRKAGPDIDLMSLFYLFVIMIVLGMLYLWAEWVDYRWIWKKSKAAIDGAPFFPRKMQGHEDPRAHRGWHDFRIRYGRMTKGIRMSRGALLRFVVLPIVILIVTRALISSVGNTITDQLSDTLGATVTVLFLVGIPIVVMSFFKGFYPKGSWSRMTFSVVIVALLDLWVWYATLQGRFQADLGMVRVDLNYQPYVLLLIFGMSLWAVYYVVELISYRKDWIAQDFQPVDEKRATERRLSEKAVRNAKKKEQQT